MVELEGQRAKAREAAAAEKAAGGESKRKKKKQLKGQTLSQTQPWGS